MDIKQERDNENDFSPLKLSIVSSLGGLLGDLALYPLDTLAVRQKVNPIKETENSVQQLIRIVKQERIKSLYRGVNTIVASTFIPYSIYFYSYEYLNHWCKQQVQKQKWSCQWLYMVPLFSSTVAEVLSLLTYLPIDIVRTRLQINHQQYQYTSIAHGLACVSQQEGFFRLYKASHLYMCNYIAYTSLQFWLYEVSRMFILSSEKEEEDRKRMKVWTSVFVSVMVSSVATIATSPIDIVFTRQQVMNTAHVSLNARQITQQIYTHEGPIAFFNGLAPKTAQNALMSLMILPIYEYFKAIYGVNLHQ